MWWCVGSSQRRSSSRDECDECFTIQPCPHRVVRVQVSRQASWWVIMNSPSCLPLLLTLWRWRIICHELCHSHHNPYLFTIPIALLFLTKSFCIHRSSLFIFLIFLIPFLYLFIQFESAVTSTSCLLPRTDPWVYIQTTSDVWASAPPHPTPFHVVDAILIQLHSFLRPFAVWTFCIFLHA